MLRLGGHDPKCDLLAGVSLFSACTPEELRHLGALTTGCSARAGQVLCREGTAGHEAFVVVEGEAEVSIGGTEIARIGPGGFFGELALLDGGPRVATVAALAPMELLVLTRDELRQVVDEAPAVAWKLLAGVGRRLREVEAGVEPLR